MKNAPTVSTDAYQELRQKTLMPHETASLFETIADISATDTESDEDNFENEDGEDVNAFASPLSLWEMKTGMYTTTPPEKRSLWSRVKWGVLDSACEKLGFEHRRPTGTYIDGIINLLSARPDFEVSDDGQNWYPMIAKNVASTMIGAWRNAIGDYVPPEHMVIEGQHYMAVTGADRFYIAALFGGVTERIIEIERDEEIIEDILAAAESFWECVTEKRMPKSSGVRDLKVLGRVNFHIDPKAAIVDMRNDKDFVKAIETKDSLSKEKRKIEKQIEELNAYLQETMQGYGSAIISDERQYKWILIGESEVSFTRKASSHLRASKIDPKAAGTLITEQVE